MPKVSNGRPWPAIRFLIRRGPISWHVYEVRPRKDRRGVNLISDVLPFGRLWYDTPDDAIGYQCTAAVHMMPSFAFTMTLETWSRRRSTRAISA
jgi:hypothetical protein